MAAGGKREIMKSSERKEKEKKERLVLGWDTQPKRIQWQVNVRMSDV